MARPSGFVTIDGIRSSAYVVPTDKPEGDGTLSWTATTLVLVEAAAGGMSGLGYTYSDASVAGLIHKTLAPRVQGEDALDPPRAWLAMQRAVRNLGREGLAATAISAVDAALWDLKAKLLELPLAVLLGRCRDEVAVYGSGGFTTYSDEELQQQLAAWVERNGCRRVKMKVGAHPEDDLDRVEAARAAIGDEVELFVDANGAYTRKQALELSEHFIQADVRWFEEPVSSDDLEGLKLVRDRAPPSIEISAGEYGYTLQYFERMLNAQAIDVLQADITRCGGVTGFTRAAALCDAHMIDLSGHCGPSIHLHAACCVPRLRHLEWFHDHARIEQLLFDGAPVVRDGKIRPDLSRPGLGIEFKRRDAERYAFSATRS